MCAFQVLNNHPQRDQLLTDFGPPGKGGGSQGNSSSHWIMRGLMLLCRYGLADYHYVTTEGSAFVVGKQIITPSAPTMAFYQLTNAGMATEYLEFSDSKVLVVDGYGNKKSYSGDLVAEDRVED